MLYLLIINCTARYIDQQLMTVTGGSFASTLSRQLVTLHESGKTDIQMDGRDGLLAQKIEGVNNRGRKQRRMKRCVLPTIQL